MTMLLWEYPIGITPYDNYWNSFGIWLVGDSRYCINVPQMPIAKVFNTQKTITIAFERSLSVANSIYAMIKSRYIIREMTYENANFF